MKRQQFFRHRLQTLSALRDAVGAMRSLSAAHFRRSRKSLSATRRYREEMETIIAKIGVQQPLHKDLPAGMLVIASDLGLCGDYNSRLSRLAVSKAQSQSVGKLYSVGRRGRGALAQHGWIPHRSYDGAASLEGLSRLLLGLAQDVLDDYMSLKIGSLLVVSARFEGVGHFEPLAVSVLPITPAIETSPIPASPYVDADHLMAVAMREYLYITLYDILLDAVASEHGMRLMASESALDWLDNQAETTARRLANARSEASTQELLDIVAGGRKKRSIVD